MENKGTTKDIEDIETLEETGIQDYQNKSSQEKIAKIKLELLSPADKKDDDRVVKYLDRLHAALKETDVYNLALTGVYGSGKSTILKSFKSKYKGEFKFLNISLASFNDVDYLKYEDFKDQIQLTILQQIIYSHPSSLLPDSRINRITEIEIWKKGFLKKVFIIFFLIITSYGLFRFYEYEINPKHWSLNDSLSYGALFFLLGFLVSLFLTVQLFFKIFSNSRINKINVKGEAELGDKIEHKDFLNKHLDELLYYFEKIPTDVVLIEDLDRFNSSEIFRTLREINFILNTYLKNSKKEPVKFLYAIRDDIFINELDRTKFFDLIIPTIPYVNYNNSKNVLSTKLDAIFSNGNETHKPSNEFISEVSSFIQDHRILLNIVNEFIVYREQQVFQNAVLTQEKLLAIIIYKNLEPNDFERIHSGNSLIDVVFSFKSNLIKIEKSKIEEEIKEIEEEIKELNKEVFRSKKILNYAFLYELSLLFPSIKGLYIGDNLVKNEDVIDKGINILKSLNNGLIVLHKNYGKVQERVDLNNINKKIGHDYESEFKRITEQELDNKTILEKKIDQKHIDIQVLQNHSLQTIFDFSKTIVMDINNLFDSRGIKEWKHPNFNKPLFYFLIRNGYIDEELKEYISVFQKGGLSDSDQEFKISIISGTPLPNSQDYKINNVKDLIEEISLRYFKTTNILNVDLFDHIVKNRNTYKSHFFEILSLMSNWTPEVAKFLKNYSKKGNYFNELLLSFMSKEDSFFDFVYREKIYDKSFKFKVVEIVLKECELINIISLNKNGFIKLFLEENISVLKYVKNEKEAEKLLEVLSENGLNFKVQDLKILVDNEYVSKVLLKGNSYVLNLKNLKCLLENEINGFDIVKFENCNFTYLNSLKIDSLLSYLREDAFKNYLNNIYLRLPNNQIEEECIYEILNNSNIDLVLKSRLIKKQKNNFSNLSEINQLEVKDLFFKENKVDSDWKNIFTFFNESDGVISENLVKFLNRDVNWKQLIESNFINGTQADDVHIKFLDEFLLTNAIKLKPYVRIIGYYLNQLTVDDIELNLKSLNQDKILFLIENNIIILNDFYYNQIEQYFNGLLVFLFAQSDSVTKEFMSKKEIGLEKIIDLLSSRTTSEVLKITILKNHLRDEYFTNFKLVDAVYNALSETKNNCITTYQFEEILKSDISVTNKLDLLLLFQDSISNENLIKYLNEFLGYPYKLAPKAQLNLDNNQQNIDLVKILKDRNIAGKSNQVSDRLKVWLKKYSVD